MSIKLIVNNIFPWPIIAVIILWVLYGLSCIFDNKAIVLLANKCNVNKYDNKELIKAFKRYFMFHPLSVYNSDLTVKMIPSLMAENKNILKWVKRITGKDLHPTILGQLLFSYFVLQENNYAEELKILQHRTSDCFADDKQFVKIKNYIFGSQIVSNEEIDLINGKYEKAIVYYYLACNAYARGEIELGDKSFETALLLVPEKAMSDLLSKRRRLL